ncbi:MAG TPA: hypothetical protein VMZ03_10175 [Chitinophagaceae bacterium]|nr:hypothetical protein [Chitinophagaceae bacterium]
MEKISTAISRYLETTEKLRLADKDRNNAEKEVNRAMAGTKRDDVYSVEDADQVLALMAKVKALDQTITALTKENEQAYHHIREFLGQLGGSVNFEYPAGSIINFSLNEYHEVIMHPN